jgi:ankyrin repeat protein
VADHLYLPAMSGCLAEASSDIEEHNQCVDDSDIEAALVIAIRTGELDTVRRLLDEVPGLAGRALGVAGGRTPLHVAADWPGYFPDAPTTVRVLLDAGADPNVRGSAEKGETPLHWAASSDDLDVADALIAGGADLEVPGGSIGTPLDNAIGYGCWNVARRLVERGARVDKLWHAAALGLLGRLDQLLDAVPPPSTKDIDEAFWQACSGGQLRAAKRLLGAGANAGFRPGYAQETSALDAAGASGTRRQLLVSWLRDEVLKP